MSDFENQYNSPETPIVPEQKRIAGNLTETMLGYLKEASPWLKFIGVLGFIGCGFTVLMGVFTAIGSISASAFFSDIVDFPFWLFSVIYLPMGVLLFFPAYFTWSFGDKISRYLYSNSDEDLEQAFKNNKSLWKFTGILSIISLAALPVLIIIMMIVSVIAAINLY
jgi:hypothetical protein